MTVDPDHLPPFTGLAPTAFTFLRDLSVHQDKIWFRQHRHVYDGEVHAPMVALIAALVSAFAKADVPFAGDPERAIHRIYRDVRFSKDKSPYKTNFSAALSRDGVKGAPGIFYVNFAPDDCFAACGFYHPESSTLDAIRSGIAAHPETFRRISADLAAAGLALSEEDVLKRNPRGYEHIEDPGIAAALRLKSFVTILRFSQRDAGCASLVSKLCQYGKSASKILELVR